LSHLKCFFRLQLFPKKPENIEKPNIHPKI
jgi:hypothetical protein